MSPAALRLSPRELAPRRAANVAAFLYARGLEPAWLAGVLGEHVGAGELLLTSSPVHGLANPSSDLDFICIRRQAAGEPPVATKVFAGGHHLEIVVFSVEQVERNLAELATLAAAPLEGTVRAFRSWDERLEPKRKQTERIVNGVTLQGTMPYVEALPSLGIVWSRASLQNAIEHAAYLYLAEAAGETRGRLGYAINAVLSLADSLLSAGGDIYTTRKWTLLRWARAALSTCAADPAVREA